MEFFFSNMINKDLIELDSIESKHCMRVLRKTIGDSVYVVDGKGNLYEGDIVSSINKNCKIKIREVVKDFNKKDYYIHIGISPIKNHDRIEWFIEKSIEIGVDEISFIKCERTLRKKIKIDRLLRTAISAMKQTLKAKIPKINDIVSFEEFILKSNQIDNFICHLEDNERDDLFQFEKSIKNNQKSCILIGPEGDFTLNEINLSKKYKFKSITLGESRLRTETAGIVSCNLLNLIHLK